MRRLPPAPIWSASSFFHRARAISRSIGRPRLPRAARAGRDRRPHRRHTRPRPGRDRRDVRPDWLQLHGNEAPDRVRMIKKRFARRVIKAIGVREPADLVAAARYRRSPTVLLLDAKPPKGATRPGRQWQRLRLGDPRGFRARHALASLRRARRRPMSATALRMAARARRRRLLGRRNRAGQEGPRPDPRLRRRRAAPRVRQPRERRFS